jgi:hypothetical protein
LTSEPVAAPPPGVDPRAFAPKGWIWKVGAVGLAAVGALFVLPRVHIGMSPPPAAAEASSPVVAVASVPVEPAVEPSRATAVPSQAPLDEQPEIKLPAGAAPVSRAARSVPAPALAEIQVDDRLKQEVKNLAEIRAAAASDPARALSLADEGNRKFSGGMLGEEREASAILALSRLGRTAEARRRAARFLEEHPRSSFAERVRLSVH